MQKRRAKHSDLAAAAASVEAAVAAGVCCGVLLFWPLGWRGLSLIGPGSVLTWALGARTSESGDLIPVLPAGPSSHGVAMVGTGVVVPREVAGAVAPGVKAGLLRLLCLCVAVCVIDSR